MELNNELRELVANIGGLKPDFDSAADLYLDLAMPSIRAMQLLVELEERFNIQIPDEQFVEARSLEAIQKLVMSLIRTQAVDANDR
jgi:acyl carrier protein